MNTRAFKVFLNRKHIDTIFQDVSGIGNKAEQEEYVKQS